MSGFTDVQIINMALDQIPADGITSRNDASESARSANRNYDSVLKKCLRRSLTPWSFATKRLPLNATSNTPVNEFQYEYTLPGDLLGVQDFWPKKVTYRLENGYLYTNATSVILKYTHDEVLTKPYKMSADFAEYFSLALAAMMSPKLSEDSNRQKELLNMAEVAYKHAASAFSMEDTPDKIPEGPWIEAHEGFYNFQTQTRSDQLLDWNSLP